MIYLNQTAKSPIRETEQYVIMNITIKYDSFQQQATINVDLRCVLKGIQHGTQPAPSHI